MKTKTIKIYSFQELSKEAQEKAHKAWQGGNDNPFLPDFMAERPHELLKENGIKDLNDTSKAGTKPTQVYYSLGYSQGDGAMFEGTFLWKGWRVKIKHSGRYYHYNSKELDIVDEYSADADPIDAKEETYKKFDALYVKICKELESYGYAYLEEEDSLERFIEDRDANGYTFTSEGKMKN